MAWDRLILLNFWNSRARGWEGSGVSWSELRGAVSSELPPALVDGC